MSLQQILQKNRDQIQKDYEGILPAEQIQKTIEYWDTLTKKLLQALYDEEEKTFNKILKKKEQFPNDPFHPVRLQYLGQQDAKQDTLNRLKSLIDSL